MIAILTGLGLAKETAETLWGYRKVFLALIAVLFILGMGFYARSCYIARQIEKTDEALIQLEGNVSNSKTAQDRIDTQTPRKDAVNASREAHEALKNTNTIRNTDSSNINSNGRTGKERFCELYPEDSLCN